MLVVRTASTSGTKTEEAGKKPMHEGPPDPGRGVYLARRIVAALVVLILLVLLVPRACQAFLGPEEEPSSIEPEKSATEEETVGETEGAPVERGTTTEEVSAVSPDDAAHGTDVVAEAEAAEPRWDLEAPLGQGYIIGEVNQTAPVPGFGAAQQAVQPLPPGQPISSAEPIVAEPILSAEPVVAEPTLPAEPIFFEGPIFFEEPLFFEEQPPFFKEEPV